MLLCINSPVKVKSVFLNTYFLSEGAEVQPCPTLGEGGEQRGLRLELPRGVQQLPQPWRRPHRCPLGPPELTCGAEVRQRDGLMWVAQLLAAHPRYVFMRTRCSCCTYICAHTDISWRVCWKINHKIIWVGRDL